MVYIPFASLLGLQAALNPFASKPEPLVSAAVPFVNPTIGGGSLLDKDSGGLGEPLNVIQLCLSSCISSVLMMSSLRVGDTGYHLGSQFTLGPVRWWLCPLCQRGRFVSFVFNDPMRGHSFLCR
jgi:hypothetical protein